METATSEEIKTAATKISSSTIFDNLIKLYGTQATGMPAITPGAEGAEGADTGGGFGGGGGGGGGGVGDLSSTLGASGGGAEMGGGGAESPAPEAPAGGEAAAPEAPAAPETPAAPLAESWNPEFEDEVNENIEYLKRISDLIEKTKI
jgi:hypothetical protein